MPREVASKTEKVFVVLALLLSTGAFMNLVIVNGIGESGMGIRVLWYVAYIGMITLFFRRCSRRGRKLLFVGPLAAVIVFAIASTLWSQDPMLSLRRSLVLVFVLLFGVYFASRFNLKDQLRLLAWVCGICIVFSFIFGLFGLGTAVDARMGVEGWYGIFIQKNILGRTMVVSALTFFFWGRAEPEHKWLARTGLLGSLVLIVLSQSMTSILVLALLIPVLPYLRWTLHKSQGRMVAGIIVLSAFGSAAILYAVTHLPQVTELIGRGPTLTGRIQVWILSCVMALRRPWLGYGYSAFWLQNQLATLRIWGALGLRMPSAHNGYIELWLELGVIGASLFLLGFVYYALRAMRLVRQDSRLVAAWPLAFLLFLLLMDLSEPIFLGGDSIFFILYAAAAAFVCLENAETHGGSKGSVPKSRYA